MLRQLSVEEAEAHPEEAAGRPAAAAAVEAGTRACVRRAAACARVHIIDGRVEEGLLAEVFSNEGIGTLIHANEYQAIRRAHAQGRPRHPRPDRGRASTTTSWCGGRGPRSSGRSTISSSSRWTATRWRAPRCISTRKRTRRSWPRVRRSALREPGHRRQADAVRRGPGPRWGRRSCSACPRRRSTISSRRAASSPARRTTCRRRGANAMTRAAGGRWCW